MNGVALSLFASRVAAVCEEAGALLGKVAFSPNIRDRLDYSCALFDARGRLLGQATHIPVHLGSMAFAMADLVQGVDWAPGDMVVLNDPYRGGTHLPDVTFISPVFLDERLVGFAANRAHHADIGAEAPGSMPLSRSLEEEGIILAPIKIIADGRWVPSVLDPVMQRLHDPDLSMGDFSAQAAANRLMERRLLELVEGSHYRAFVSHCEDLQDYACQLATASLAELPEGQYRFTDYLDDDGQGHLDLPVTVTVSLAGGKALVDFTGTSDAVPGNLNCPLPVTAAAVFYVFRCLMPSDVPACDGAMRNIDIQAPPGCLVNALAPSAVAAGNVETSTRIVDAVCGALALADPERIPAAAQGTMNNLAMGARGEGGWDYYETLAGGHGACSHAHGCDARHSHMTNTLNTPVEVVERHYPLRIEHYAIRSASGGAGRNHGGDGVSRAYRFLADAQVTVLSERRRRAPWGLAGGQDGKPGENRLDGEVLPAKVARSVNAGQLLEIDTPGGGGFGKPDSTRR